MTKQKSPDERIVNIDMDRVRGIFLAKTKGKTQEEREKLRGKIRTALESDPHFLNENIPLYLKTAQQASEKLFNDLLETIFENFPEEESVEVIGLFVKTCIERLCKKNAPSR